jgi:hypothetical protein
MELTSATAWRWLRDLHSYAVNFLNARFKSYPN